MTRLTFSKNYFTRKPELDFSDDGTRFRVYYFNDKLPLTVATACGMRFVAIRLDYLGKRWQDYKNDYAILNEFNGVDDVNMYRLIVNCKKIMDKYVD